MTRLPETPRAIKSFGQNFLRHPRTQKRIVDACNLTSKDNVLEIGPGKGAITILLAEQAKHVWALDKDKRMVEFLQQNIHCPNVTVLQKDILKFNPSDLPQPFVIVGNIPYYISTPILEWMIEHRNVLSKAFLTVQWEFAQRLAASSGTKDYGSLSCFVQYYASVKKLFKLSRNEFNPVPKVDSCFIEIDFSKAGRKQARNEERLFQIIRTVFQQRRKQLPKLLAKMEPSVDWESVLKKLHIPLTSRAENLSLDQFIALADDEARE